SRSAPSNPGEATQSLTQWWTDRLPSRHTPPLKTRERKTMTAKRTSKGTTRKKLTLAKRTVKDLAASARQGKGVKGGRSGMGCKSDNSTREAAVPPAWSPLLGGGLRAQALDAVQAIATSLSAGEFESVEANGGSLVEGPAGLAVFFAYLEQAGLASRGSE